MSAIRATFRSYCRPVAVTGEQQHVQVSLRWEPPLYQSKVSCGTTTAGRLPDRGRAGQSARPTPLVKLLNQHRMRRFRCRGAVSTPQAPRYRSLNGSPAIVPITSRFAQKCPIISARLAKPRPTETQAYR